MYLKTYNKVEELRLLVLIFLGLKLIFSINIPTHYINIQDLGLIFSTYRSNLIIIYKAFKATKSLSLKIFGLEFDLLRLKMVFGFTNPKK